MNYNVINTWRGRGRNKKSSSFHRCQPPIYFIRGGGGRGRGQLEIVERTTFSEEGRFQA